MSSRDTCRLVITRFADGTFAARVEGRAATGLGASEREAIGDLVISRPDFFLVAGLDRREVAAPEGYEPDPHGDAHGSVG